MKNDGRRRFLSNSALLLGAGALAWTWGGCAGPVRRAANRAYLLTPVNPQPGRAVLAWQGGKDVDRLCRELIGQISDMRWLKPGDSVFVKVACNSPNEHPAVTCPEAVGAVVEFLKGHGAGTVYVGDQSGAEHVRLWATGRKSSTREVMAENGLLAAIEQSGATLHCFDDQDYDGYFRPPDDFPNYWRGAIRLPKILRRVDHVVYLPRLGTHALAGVSCATKNAVGWLRDDSRLHLHTHGRSFFEQIAEINLFSPLREKLRFSLSLGTGALLNIGPDFGAKYDFDGVLGIASNQLVDHDCLATALLVWFDRQQTSLFDAYRVYPEDADFWNRNVTRGVWGARALRNYTPLVAYPLGQPLAYDRCLSHLAVLQGYRPPYIALQLTGDRIRSDLRSYLRGYGGALFGV